MKLFASIKLFAIFLCAYLPELIARTTPAGLTFLEENLRKDGVVVLPSGLQYRVLQEGEGQISPNESSQCQCHYKGVTIDGIEFDSSYKRGAPTTFAPNQVIPGWKEALQLMKEGDVWELVIPSELAYGDRSMGQYITPGSVLVFELHLEKIAAGTPLTYFASIFGGGPPVWMLIAAYVSYILLFKIAPYIKSNYFPNMKKGPLVSLIDAIEHAANSKVFLDVTIGEEPAKRLEITLFNSVVPKTAENFRCLCTGEKGKGPSGKPMHFKGTSFHRIIPGFMLQGGDTTQGNGTGGESIYGAKFDDEFDGGMVEHTQPFLLSMANAGPNTNGSQFFITLATTAWLDGKHVVFGAVTSQGCEELLRGIEKTGSSSGKPSMRVTIQDCGELKSKAT